MGYSALQAARLTGSTEAQLRYWQRIGLVAPDDGDYSFRDLVALRVVASLLEAGLALGRVREAVRYLLASGDDIAGLRLTGVGAQDTALLAAALQKGLFGPQDYALLARTPE